MHQPQKEKPQDEERAKVVRQKRTWTYVDENGQDLGQNYLEQRQDGQDNNVSIFFIYYLRNYFSNLLLILQLDYQRYE